MNEDSDFLVMIQDLQRKIDRDEEKTYSKKVIQEYRNPTNFGFIENPDASAQVTGSCHDTMRIDLKIQDSIILDGRFWTDGCGASLACGNMLLSMIKDMSIKDIKTLSTTKLLDALDGLPEEHQHCAELAVTTLQKVINTYQKRKEI